MEMRFVWRDLDISLQGEPDEFAALLASLMGRASAEARPVAQPPRESTLSPEARAAMAMAQSLRRRGQSRPEPARAYRGRASRRERVLAAMARLLQDGLSEQRLADIQRQYETMFPEAPTDNLAQVVRDLANKTDKVTSVRRGVFAFAGQRFPGQAT